MPLSETELKQIEQEAKSWAASMITGLPVNNERAWEEIYKAISKHQAEKYQNEVDALRVGKQYWIEGSKQVLKNRDEYEKYLKDQLASRDSELRELREVAQKLVQLIERQPKESDYHRHRAPGFNDFISADARWNKEKIKALAAYRKIMSWSFTGPFV